MTDTADAADNTHPDTDQKTNQQSQDQQGQKETLGFQTEVKQLLQLMIHSLYSNKEIFLRELISNASDACDKLRFEAIQNPELNENDSDLKIKIEFNSEQGTVTIRDNGIGMSRDEVISNLGTIAKSGTAEFLGNLSGDKKKDSALIGQFGVGFYSSFIVADNVVVRTRRAGLDASEGVEWASTGDGEFTIAAINKPERGTEIVLHLREDQKEFADNWRLRSLIKKYSDHIGFPVLMDKPPAPKDDDDKDEKAVEVPEEETVNSAQALWSRSPQEIKEDEYKEFYKSVSHDFADPLTWSHNRIEGKLEYSSLLYIPAKAPYDLWQREGARGLKLYVQRVFIMDQAEQFLPLYLRFVKGIVDSSDLSLNISRELLQQDAVVESMKKALTKRVLGMLEKLDNTQYATFWKEFGDCLKEGIAEDYANRDQLMKLYSFASTHQDTSEENVSLEDYVSRMKDGQDDIYYIVADSYATAKNSPHIEGLKARGYEVLLLSHQIDEWFMSQMHEFEGKKFHDITKGDLNLEEDEATKEKREASEKALKGLTERVKKVLEADIEEVRLTYRLTDSPACLVLGEHDLGPQLREMLKQAGQDMPASKPSLELNPEHVLVKKLDEEKDDGRFGVLAHVLHDQAKLAAGEQLDDPASYVKRVNELLTA